MLPRGVPRMLLFLLLEGIRFALAGEATVSSSTATSVYQIRPGWEFSVEVQGTNFDVINDKIYLVGQGSSCGDSTSAPRGRFTDGNGALQPLSTAADYQTLMCDGIGKGPTKLVCSGMSILQVGTWTICVCDADAIAPPSAGAGTNETTTTTSVAPTPLPCNVPERFWLGGLGTGVMTVNGPRNEGTLDWRAGTSDRLILQGTGLSSADRIRIVAGTVDCYDFTHSKQMHPAVASDVPYLDPSGERYDGDSTMERWLDIGVMIPGTYQVCWCSAGQGSCDSDEDFTTNVATLAVGGPTAGVVQTFECITGVACTLPIEGSGLSQNDRIYIIAEHLECGTAPQSFSVNQGAGSSGERTSGSDIISRFGGIIMGSHGTFKVCWCGSYDPISCPACCQTMQEYTVYAGNLTSGGPIQGQVDRPAIAVPFSYTITGWGLSDVDRIRIVDSTTICGQAGAEVHSLGLEASTVPNGPPSIVEGDTSLNRTSVSWTNIIAREMRKFRVCWCAHYYLGCTQGFHFALDIGVINPRGASNTTSIEAIPGRPFSLTVTAAVGSVLSGDDRIRIVHSSLSDGKCGAFGTGEHSLAVSMISCWPSCVDSPVSGAPEMGENNETEVWDPVLITESGEYNICWCNAGQGGCDNDEDFAFKAGVINARGVNVGLHFHCAAYFPCVVEIPLTDGLTSNDYLQMVQATPSASCGTDPRAPATSFSRGTRIRGYQGKDQNAQDVVIFEFGSPQAPGVFLACYCQGNVCNSIGVSDRDFFQQAGQVTVMGLEGRDEYHKCYLRGTCHVHLRGTGLDAQDALMLVDPMDNCGQQGIPVSFSTDGSKFFTESNDRIFVGNFAAETNEGLEGWNFNLGTPVRTGRYRMCYCMRTRATNGVCENRIDFDNPAGELFVRGSDFSTEFRCDQGEPCLVTSRSSQWDALDRMVLLKAGENHTCGMVNGGQYPYWSSALTPNTIRPDAILPDLWAATWQIASVREPGTYHICYCAYIIGSASCVESSTTNYQGFMHELGTVRVSGAILAVRRVGVTPGAWKPPLPAAPFAVSVEVDAQTTFLRYSCVATTRAAPEDFIPMKSDLENCTLDIELLSDRQKFFPRCWGTGTTVEAVIEQGPNVVHVPVHIPEVTLETAEYLHVWCYPRNECSNGRCVMPSNNIGLTMPITGGLISTTNNWASVVSTSFSLRLPVASDYDVDASWARAKIITFNSACDATQLHPSVIGLTCLESGVGKCEPAPVATLSSGSWGSGRELIWSGIAVNRADKFHVCYCDRHYAATCMAWVKVGVLSVSGPQGSGSLRFVANPAQPTTISIQGIGLATEDRIRIIPQTVGCMQVTEGTTPTTTGAGRRMQSSMFDFRSGAATNANGTEASWDILIAPEGTYNVCWCGASEGSCTSGNDYSVQLGTLQVAKKRDCEVTDWWVVDECNKVCGGGEVRMKRAITQEAHDSTNAKRLSSSVSSQTAGTPGMATALRSGKSAMKKNPTRSLTFESNVLAEILEAEPVPTTAPVVEEEEVVQPPPSSPPAVLMSTIQPALVSEEPPVPAPDGAGASQGEKTGSNPEGSPEPTVCASLGEKTGSNPEGNPEPTVSSDESKQSRNSRRSKYSTGSVVTDRSGRDLRDLERTLTQQTLDSQVDHTAETLRARLGVRSGMVSGKVLHDAAVALGLTRFSEEDVNMLVNRLADFVDLELQHQEKHFRVQRSATLTDKVMRRSALTGMTRPADPSVLTVDPLSCRPKWKWPEEQATSVPEFWRTRMNDLPQRSWNVVPFRALVYAFVMDADARKIFGPSAEHFRALKEILLASDTNRLVAELTFVRINDLAAPQTASDPFLFLEPFVALLIVVNAVLLGVQTDEELQHWEGWPLVEIGFTVAMFAETTFRLFVVGRREYFCGVESSWNYFDLFLLLTSTVDIILTYATDSIADSPTQLLRAIRLARLTRMFRVFRLKFIKELQLMIKGLVGGLRTLVLAFALLFVVLYIIAVFATITICRGADLDRLDGLRSLFRSVPSTMFTAFRCYSGECISEDGLPVALLLADEFGPVFVLLYVAGYMLVTMGIFNVILAVYVDITMKAARENEARTSEQHERESIRVARLTRELVKKFKIAVETRRHDEDDEDGISLQRSPSSMTPRAKTTVSGDDDDRQSDQIQISKELFLLVIQDRQVQRLMDDLDLPKDRANLFEALDADSSGALHLAELAQGLLKVRGELKKTDTVATLLATKAVYATLEQIGDQIMDLRRDVAKAMGDESIGVSKPQKSIFEFS